MASPTRAPSRCSSACRSSRSSLRPSVLSSALHQEKFGQIIIQTLTRVLPGNDNGDMVEQAAQRSQDQGVTGGQLALWLGLLAAIIALTTAMGQIERGVNRIYGIERDRPAAAEIRSGSADGVDRRPALAARIPRHHRR